MSRCSSPGSNKCTDSYTSLLSDDSYLNTLKPGIDDHFKEMLSCMEMNENHRNILKERKIQSHEVKKRDPSDVNGRIEWTPQMNADYASYKSKVNVIKAAKSVQKASKKVARDSKNADVSIQEEARDKAIEDGEKWVDAAIEAATARLGFMAKYPNAFDTPSTKTHIGAIEDNLNSAKKAVREIEIQQKKIADAKAIAARHTS
ncbi:hypothetical protein F4803DRAFT_556960 [Xylaria telfairii]|nr:hypothetical protein F4803DRAFT_556960 [Xylaria telfairii]